MSYSFHAWITDQAVTTGEMVAALADSLSDASVEEASGKILVRVDDWTLRGSLNDGSWVSEEAAELVSSFGDDMSDGQKEVVAQSKARFEFEPAPGADTDDHYNTWLIAAETLGGLRGVVIFFPFDATFIG